MNPSTVVRNFSPSSSGVASLMLGVAGAAVGGQMEYSCVAVVNDQL